MIQLPPHMTAADIQQWCHECTVLARIRGELVPAQFMNTDGIVVLVQPLSTKKTVAVSPESVFVTWPRLGCFNGNGYAFFMEQRTAKQYRRSINYRNVRVRVPNGWRIANARNTTLHVMRAYNHVIPYVFDPKYPADMGAAESIIADGAMSVALDRRIIMSSINGGKTTFYVDGGLTASAQDGLLLQIGKDEEYVLLTDYLRQHDNYGRYRI